MDKIVVSTREIAAVPRTIGEPVPLEPQLPPVISWWMKALFSLLVVVLPLLCLLAIILRVAFRNQPPRVKHAWTAFLSTLLIISGFLTSAAAVLTMSFVPLPPVVSSSLDELDQRAEFPHLPSDTPMTGSSIAATLKPQVAVITPARRVWFGNQEGPSGSLGAGILIKASASGYLFATAHHVVDGEDWRSGTNSRALVAMASGIWAGATVVARHKSLDVVLLWVPRESGHGDFIQPISSVVDGENIFVIGHPEGLKFTISNGMVSRTDQSAIMQISAPVSPGNSGGPVFDDRGDLLGIVVSKMDRQMVPNAENLNFAVRAGALLDESGWQFTNTAGRQQFTDFLNAHPLHEAAKVVPAPDQAKKAN